MMMNRLALALAATVASVFAAAAFADTASNSAAPSSRQYGYGDYYAVAQDVPPAPPSDVDASAPHAAPRPAVAAPTPAEGDTKGVATAGDEGGASGGCNAGCGCDCCGNERLRHWLTLDWKLQPCFCWHDDCPLDCPEECTRHWFDDRCWLKDHDTTLTGWIDGGIMGNSQSPATHFNGPVTFADQDFGQLNQFYAVLQRTPADLSKNCGWFVGGDIDFFWGSDYFFTTAAGLDGTKHGNVPRWYTDGDRNYGYSMPQAYVETDYDDLRIKWGHFYTIVCYETAPATENFFYTHSYALQYAEPLTHTGVLASRNINENWAWSAGIVSGWNDFDLQDGAQFLGGISYSDKAYGSLAFSIVSGNESDFNVPGVGPESNRTMYSLVWTRNLTSRWTYVLQHDLGVQQNTLGFNALDSKRAEWYGINQYLYYKINCCWSLGGRFEWFDDPQGYLVTGLRPGNTDAEFRFPGSFYEASLGVNYKPNGNLTVRAEVRYDWYDGRPGFISPGIPGFPPNLPYNDNLSTNQFLYGVDVAYKF